MAILGAELLEKLGLKLLTCLIGQLLGTTTLKTTLLGLGDALGGPPESFSHLAEPPHLLASLLALIDDMAELIGHLAILGELVFRTRLRVGVKLAVCHLGTPYPLSPSWRGDQSGALALARQSWICTEYTAAL